MHFDSNTIRKLPLFDNGLKQVEFDLIYFYLASFMEYIPIYYKYVLHRCTYYIMNKSRNIFQKHNN